MHIPTYLMNFRVLSFPILNQLGVKHVYRASSRMDLHQSLHARQTYMLTKVKVNIRPNLFDSQILKMLTCFQLLYLPVRLIHLIWVCMGRFEFSHSRIPCTFPEKHQIQTISPGQYIFALGLRRYQFSCQLISGPLLMLLDCVLVKHLPPMRNNPP